MSQFCQSRRRFLQLAGTSMVAAPWLLNSVYADNVLPRKAMGMPDPGVRLPDQPQPKPQPGSVGFAVVGLGGYGLGNVMPALARAENCHVAAVVSGNPKKAARAAAAYGVPEDAIYNYDNFDKIASDERIEAVYIVLPSGLHADWTEKAFAAGKHVLCEKPMALSSAECQRMIDASEKANKKLMIAYRCHYEPYNLEAMRLMADGAVGKIQTIETFQQYRMGPTSLAENWRVVRSLAGGGPLEDYGIYGLQSALYLSGELPVQVKAVTEQPANDPRFAEIFSTVSTQLQFPSGATASLRTSYDTSPGRNSAEVVGDAGVLLMEPATNYSGNRMTLTSGGSSKQLNPGDSSVQFYRQCDHFASAIRENAVILTPGEMGLRDVRLMEAIYQSAASRQPVKV